MTDRRDNGSDFRFEATIKPGEDPKEAETRWYRCNEEVKRWEFYGNEVPSWDELSERNKDTFATGTAPARRWSTWKMAKETCSGRSREG